MIETYSYLSLLQREPQLRHEDMPPSFRTLTKRREQLYGLGGELWSACWPSRTGRSGWDHYSEDFLQVSLL